MYNNLDSQRLLHNSENFMKSVFIQTVDAKSKNDGSSLCGMQSELLQASL